jgi:excisionase family DNA binding protein
MPVGRDRAEKEPQRQQEILVFFAFTVSMDTVAPRRDGHATDALLTTGQVAVLLGSSRQHVVDLCASGRLPYQLVGTHRRVRRADVEALRNPELNLTRDQLRSLWLHRAVAGKLALDPPRVLRRAKRNLLRMRQAHPQGGVQADFDAWEELLGGPLEQLFDVLLSTSPMAIQLRQNTPFAGVLSPAERAKALSAFRASWQAK